MHLEQGPPFSVGCGQKKETKVAGGKGHLSPPPACHTNPPLHRRDARCIGYLWRLFGSDNSCVSILTCAPPSQSP